MKLSRLAIGVALASLPLASVQANQSLVAPGYSSTFGSASTHGSVHSSRNPAANRLLIAEGERFRFGYLSNLGGYIEIGDADDFDVLIDELVDELEEADTNNPAELEAIASDINNNILPTLEDGGQISFGGQIQAPLTPFLFNSNRGRGTFSLNASASLQAQARVLTGPFSVRTGFTNLGDDDFFELDLNQAASAYSKFDSEDINDINDLQAFLERDDIGLLTEQNRAFIEANAGVTDLGEANSKLYTDTGIDVRAALMTHLSLGYGTSLTDWLNLDRSWGEFEGGIALNLYQVEAGRNFISLYAESQDDDGDDTSDELFEDMLDNTETTTALGLDIGVLWHQRNYQAGLTIYNVNEPEIDYPDLSEFIENGDTLTALNGLQERGKLSTEETVTLTRHAVLEGGWYSMDRRWAVHGYATLGTATNALGEEFQNLGVTAAYTTNSWWLPGVRAGYHVNQAGSELSRINLGTTLFGIMNADLAVSPETNSFDGNDVPRYVAFSIGFEERF